MKKKYNLLKIKVIEFEDEDLMGLSGGTGFDFNDDPYVDDPYAL